MNREIKFRVWGSTEKTFKHQCNIFPFIGKIGMTCNGSATGVVSTDDWIQEEYILMQFTGLTDKNGKEIYEGDIVIQPKLVEVGTYTNTKGIVTYIMREFTVKCIGDWVGAHADLNGNCEIIGNIYENPELIK